MRKGREGKDGSSSGHDTHGFSWQRGNKQPGAPSASGSLENLPNSELKANSQCNSQSGPREQVRNAGAATTPDLGSQELGKELSNLCTTSWGAGESRRALPQRATVPSQSHLHFTAGAHLAWTPVRKTACTCTHCTNLISKAYFHPVPHLTLIAATRERRAGHWAFLFSRWKTKACQLEVQAGPEQTVGP